MALRGGSMSRIRIRELLLPRTSPSAPSEAAGLPSGEQVEYYGIESTGFSTDMILLMIKTYFNVSIPAIFKREEVAVRFVSC